MQQTNTNKHPNSVGALWIRESETGSEYLSLKIEKSKIQELLKSDGDLINIKGFYNGSKNEGDDRPNFLLFPSKNKSTHKEINGNK